MDDLKKDNQKLNPIVVTNEDVENNPPETYFKDSDQANLPENNTSQTNPEEVITTSSPHVPRKYGGPKIIATIFGVLFILGGLIAGVILVQRSQEIRKKAQLGPIPPPRTINAQCLGVRAYDTNWNLLTQEQLSNLRPGSRIYLAVSGTTNAGTFDKARFTINGVQRSEVTTRTPNSDIEFYDEFIIREPEDVASRVFTITGQIHHTELGWIY